MAPRNMCFTSVKAFSCLGGLTTQSGDPVYKTSCNFPAQADAEEKKHADKHIYTPNTLYLQTRHSNLHSPAKHQHAKTQTKNLKTHTFKTPQDPASPIEN